MNGKNILITGGTGSFGQKFVKKILLQYPDVRRIVIYSRDEMKQFEMKKQYPEKDFPQLRFYRGCKRQGAIRKGG